MTYHKLLEVGELCHIYLLERIAGTTQYLEVRISRSIYFCNIIASAAERGNITIDSNGVGVTSIVIGIKIHAPIGDFFSGIFLTITVKIDKTVGFILLLCIEKESPSSIIFICSNCHFGKGFLYRIRAFVLIIPLVSHTILPIVGSPTEFLCFSNSIFGTNIFIYNLCVDNKKRTIVVLFFRELLNERHHSSCTQLVIVDAELIKL